MTANLLTSGQAAERLRMLHARLLRLARAGAIPHIALPDGELRFEAGELDAWVRQHRRPQLPSGETADGD